MRMKSSVVTEWKGRGHGKNQTLEWKQIQILLPSFSPARKSSELW